MKQMRISSHYNKYQSTDQTLNVIEQSQSKMLFRLLRVTSLGISLSNLLKIFSLISNSVRVIASIRFLTVSVRNFIVYVLTIFLLHTHAKSIRFDQHSWSHQSRAVCRHWASERERCGQRRTGRTVF